jgi:hypothetical protein
VIDPAQFRRLVRATLAGLRPIPYSAQAETLLLITAAHESRLGEFLWQRAGPARGAWQMEPATLEDHYRWMQAGRPDLLRAVEGLRPAALGRDEALVGNLPYACALARVHYWRRPERIPGDLDGMAALAKRAFNTEAGRATADAYKRAYLEFYGG